MRFTLPATNSKFAPENGLNMIVSFGMSYFQGLLLLVLGKLPWTSHDWTINHQLNRTRPYDVSKRCSIVAAGLWILHGWIFCNCLGSKFGAPCVFFNKFSRITIP